MRSSFSADRRQERENASFASLIAQLKREGQEELERLADGMGLKLRGGSKTAPGMAVP